MLRRLRDLRPTGCFSWFESKSYVDAGRLRDPDDISEESTDDNHDLVAVARALVAADKESKSDA